MNDDNGYRNVAGLRGIVPTAEDFKDELHWRNTYRSQQRARDWLRNEGWKSPDPGRSLADARLDPPSPPRHIIHNLLPEGISMLAAQYKAGKTTLGVDMGACLVSGDDFLEYFDVDVIAGNVGYWNLEVDESVIYEWQDMRIKRGASRFITANLRGQTMDLLHDRVAEWTVRWLKEYDIDVWMIDPIGRMLEEENSSSEFSRWFRALERIATEAGIRATLLIHHSGHAASGQEDSIPRARGASSMMGNTDCNISYYHSGDLGSSPPNSLRYLSAFGRGIDQHEISLDFDKRTGRIFVVDGASRYRDILDRYIDLAVAAIEEAGQWVLNRTELKAAIGGHAGNRDKVINSAVSTGVIIARKDGKATVYAIPEEDAEHRVRIRLSRNTQSYRYPVPDRYRARRVPIPGSPTPPFRGGGTGGTYRTSNQKKG